ncbi:MAG: hypothetical protein M5U26_27965 [Planctomycetota bacterium]|nr:hypothetical protein [Planctomycetota bacterium]
MWWESLLVGAIVAAACGWTLRFAWRSMRGASGCGCGKTCTRAPDLAAEPRAARAERTSCC